MFLENAVASDALMSILRGRLHPERPSNSHAGLHREEAIIHGIRSPVDFMPRVSEDPTKA
jgi:hypothetical protein